MPGDSGVRYKVLGKTGLKVSVIGFGAIKLPNVPIVEGVRG